MKGGEQEEETGKWAREMGLGRAERQGRNDGSELEKTVVK